MCFTAYGTRLGIRANDPAVLEQLLGRLPPGWEPSMEPEVEGLYSLFVGGCGARKGIRSYHRVYAGASRMARTLDLGVALDHLESHMQWVVAANSTEHLFVHAGVVGWQGKAIVIPGRSFSGKSCLVEALLKAGATYYSDEYAIFDRQGCVWPYPRPVSLRQQESEVRRRCSPAELGADAGRSPLPVGLVVVTQYQPGARWRACTLSPAQALVALLDNTVAVRNQPEHTLTTLQQVVLQATAIKSKRGEAAAVAPLLLRKLE